VTFEEKLDPVLVRNTVELKNIVSLPLLWIVINSFK